MLTDEMTDGEKIDFIQKRKLYENARNRKTVTSQLNGISWHYKDKLDKSQKVETRSLLLPRLFIKEFCSCHDWTAQC